MIKERGGSHLQEMAGTAVERRVGDVAHRVADAALSTWRLEMIYRDLRAEV